MPGRAPSSDSGVHDRVGRLGERRAPEDHHDVAVPPGEEGTGPIDLVVAGAVAAERPDELRDHVVRLAGDVADDGVRILA